MDIINSNPYRLLGVFSNSPIREQIANANKLKAYLKVGKSVTFPMDLLNLMPPPIRTDESMEHANRSINLSQDQLKYALFWFIKGSSIDDIALVYLQNGDAEKAKELFAKKETFSSLINQGVLALMQDDRATAIQCITKVIHDGDYRNAFVESICGSTYQISEDGLAQMFIDELLVEVPAQQLMQLFSDYGTSADDDNYLKKKVINEPIVLINAEIAKAKSVKNDDSVVQYEAGVALMNGTKEPLKHVKSLLEPDDMQYQLLADNLAKQILQCGINYYNNAVDEEEYIQIDKAYKLQSYACSIAIGKFTKDRCKKNIEILDEKKKELPPISIKEYDKFIKTELFRYQTLPNLITHAIELIKKCTPYLMSVKEELGSTDSYYLKLSTLIVNAALYNVIEEFNSVSNDSLRFELLIDKERVIRKVKAVFQEAWIATLCMDKLDMEEDFRISRYSPNRASLKEQISGISICTSQAIPLEMRSDSRMFNDCKSILDCQKYLKTFPKGKFVTEVKAKLEKYEFDICVTTQDCSVFKKKYPNSKLSISRKWEDCYFNTCKTIEDYQGYLSAYPNGRFIFSAKGKIEEIAFNHCKTINDYREYLQKYPSGTYKDKAQRFVSEEEYWESCIASDTKTNYRNYLAQYPNGRHKVEAQQKANAWLFQPHSFSKPQSVQPQSPTHSSMTSEKEESWGIVLLSWGFVISIIVILILLAFNN